MTTDKKRLGYWPTSTILILILTSSILSQNCTVDKCLVCPDTTNITCTSCDQGYYLKTFEGGDKTYNACWKTTNLIWGMLAGLGTSLLMCYLCKVCFDIGKKEVMTENQNSHMNKNINPSSLKSTPK